MAEETSNVTLEDIRQEQAENSTFSFQAIYKALILNWYWFILSLIIFLGGAYIYLRYSTPTYQVQTKLLVKDDDSKNGGMSSSLANASASTLGYFSKSPFTTTFTLASVHWAASLTLTRSFHASS